MHRLFAAHDLKPIMFMRTDLTWKLELLSTFVTRRVYRGFDARNALAQGKTFVAPQPGPETYLQGRKRVQIVLRANISRPIGTSRRS